MKANRMIKANQKKLYAISLFLFLLGCQDDAKGPRLAPKLLHDEAETAAYVESFPYDQYKIYKVPNLGSFYVDDNPAWVKEKIRRGEPWDSDLIKDFEDYIVPGMTVLDVGAHIGSLTVPLARLVGEGGRVYAFEPQKKIFRELVHNIRLNKLTNVIPLRFAVSSKADIIEMDSNKFDGRIGIGKGGDKAEARTIDSFGFDNISVIKIDVEGHTAQVLMGAKKTIRKFHPVIFVEIWEKNREAVLPIFDELGYTLRQTGRMDYIATFDG